MTRRRRRRPQGRCVEIGDGGRIEQIPNAAFVAWRAAATTRLSVPRRLRAPATKAGRIAAGCAVNDGDTVIGKGGEVGDGSAITRRHIAVVASRQDQIARALCDPVSLRPAPSGSIRTETSGSGHCCARPGFVLRTVWAHPVRNQLVQVAGYAHAGAPVMPIRPSRRGAGRRCRRRGLPVPLGECATRVCSQCPVPVKISP